MSNSDNTTGLMSGGMESWKLISALFQMMVCIGSDGSVLPERSQIRNVRSNTGFTEECMLDISDIVLSAAAACVEMYFAITSKELRVGDIPTVQHLVDCAVLHHVRLSRLFKSLKLSTTVAKKAASSGKDPNLVPWNKAIGGNKCHLLRQHLVESKIWMGANPRQTDTELSESFHKDTVKKTFVQSSKRHSTRQHEMATVLLRRRIVSNLMDAANLQQASSKRARASAVFTADTGNAGKRLYHFISESTPFAKFETSDDRFVLEDTQRQRFFHPCITDAILFDEVNRFYDRHDELSKLSGVEVFAIQSVTVKDSGKNAWKVLCKPAYVMAHDGDCDEGEQMFSGAFGCIDLEQDVFFRILGVVLFMGKRRTARGSREIQKCFYVAFMQPFEQRRESSIRTYLPFPVVYPEFRVVGRRNGRDIKRFAYYFEDLDGLARPAAVIRMPESIVEEAEGFLESDTTFSRYDFSPPFLAIDLSRFTWPKDRTWTPSSYAAEEVKHHQEQKRSIPLYPLPDKLSRLQNDFGLEAVLGTGAAVTDSLEADVPAISPEEDDSEDLRFLLADL